MTRNPQLDTVTVGVLTLVRAAVARAFSATHYRRNIMLLMVVVLAHWVEHILQAVRIWALGWSARRREAPSAS